MGGADGENSLADGLKEAAPGLNGVELALGGKLACEVAGVEGAGVLRPEDSADGGFQFELLAVEAIKVEELGEGEMDRAPAGPLLGDLARAGELAEADNEVGGPLMYCCCPG